MSKLKTFEVEAISLTSSSERRKVLVKARNIRRAEIAGRRQHQLFGMRRFRTITRLYNPLNHKQQENL